MFVINLGDSFFTVIVELKIGLKLGEFHNKGKLVTNKLSEVYIIEIH